MNLETLLKELELNSDDFLENDYHECDGEGCCGPSKSINELKLKQFIIKSYIAGLEEAKTIAQEHTLSSETEVIFEDGEPPQEVMDDMIRDISKIQEPINNVILNIKESIDSKIKEANETK
jgi:hypothetical protein